MKKKVFGRKLSRSRPAREALFAQLIRSMILSGKVITTRAKAKAVQGSIEEAVTIGKKGGLSGQRKILASLDNARDALSALTQKVVPSFAGRTSGYTRLISLPRRRGDNAQMMKIEWTEKIEEPKTEKKEKVKKTPKTKAVKKVKVVKKEVKKDAKNVSTKRKRS